MKLYLFGSIIACSLLFLLSQIVLSQSQDKTENDAARVTMSVNTDGSRTIYKFDDAQHKAVATTTGPDGKIREKIRYDMDDAGRFSRGVVFGPDGRFRFKSHYTYDSAGRIQEETQSAENDTLLHKIIYSYDSAGKQTGYSIYDANGKLLGRTMPLGPSRAASPKSREKR